MIASNRTANQCLFAALVCCALVLQMFFLANIIQWRTAPDLGWTPMRALGPRIIGATTSVGEQAGLQFMDRILELNGKSYHTYDERIALTNLTVGQVNEYRIERFGKILTVRVTTAPLGIRAVLVHSGPYWTLGMLFLGIGILVFLMKPYHGPSWAFFLMTMFLSIRITYTAPSYFFKPAWLDNV